MYRAEGLAEGLEVGREVGRELGRLVGLHRQETERNRQIMLLLCVDIISFTTVIIQLYNAAASLT
jgi:predicted transposase YdaD